MQVLSVQIDPPFVRVALIQKSQKKIMLHALKSALLTEPADVKALYIAFKGHVVSGLSAKDLFVRPITLDTSKNRHLEEALAFQSEALSYFDPKTILDVPYVLNKKGAATEALIFTVPRQVMQDHLQELSTLDLDPDQVSSLALAQVRYIRWKLPTLTDAFLVNLGSSEWSCSWMKEGELKKCYTLKEGVEDLLAALWQDRKKTLLLKELSGAAKQLDLMQLKSHYNVHLFKKLMQMRQELSKAIFSFHRFSKELPILFTGRVDAFLHLNEFLVEGVRDAVSAQCNSTLPQEELKYAICLGLALESKLQLRCQEFFPKKIWKRAGRYALMLGAASLLLSGALLFFGKHEIERRREDLLTSLQASLNRWDPKAESFSDPEEALGHWRHALERFSAESPYLVAAPKVGEVFSWLSHHPLLLREESIQLQEMRYRLVQFPHIGSLKEPYRVKVELTFQVTSPRIARQFHEYLLKGDEWIDAKKEISWETLQNGYRTSFFLKNRSPHA